MLKSVAPQVSTASSRAFSTISVELSSLSRHSQSSRTRCRPTLFIRDPSPHQHGCYHAAYSLDSVVAGPDHHLLQRQASPPKGPFNHLPHNLLGYVERAHVGMFHHYPVGPPAYPNADRAGNLLALHA